MNMTTGESRKSLKKKKHLSSSSSFKIWVPNQQKNNSRNKIKPWRISDTCNSRKWNILMELDYKIEEKSKLKRKNIICHLLVFLIYHIEGYLSIFI
jgi:hypothetical protein